jgi:hypothetical protein
VRDVPLTAAAPLVLGSFHSLLSKASFKRGSPSLGSDWVPTPIFQPAVDDAYPERRGQCAGETTRPSVCHRATNMRSL